MALLRSIATVGGYTMASRVLGFVRDILLAAILGAGPVADAFFVAFKFPNFFRRLFAEGAFNAAFVPLFSRALAESGRDRARILAEDALAVLLTALFALLLISEITMPWLMYVIAPGFADSAEKFDLAVALTRITFPYLLFISLVSLMGGVLNGLGRFAAAASAPILLNLFMIAALLWLASATPTPGHALAWAVAAAGAAQFLWLVAGLGRAGMRLALPRPRLTPAVRKLLRLMLPGAIGAGVVQVNLLIDVIIASLLPGGSVSFLYYADRVNQLPLGVIGVAVGTALLPLMSRQLRSGEVAAANDSQNRALEFALLFTLPAAAALIAVSGPIVSVLFERGAFAGAEARATAGALAAYAVGLPAYVLIKVLAPGYFAREDTATPVKIAAVCVAINLGLNLALMGPLGHVGIALATAISAWVNAGLLGAGLLRRRHIAPDARLVSRVPRMVLASGLLAGALFFAVELLGAPLAGGTGSRIAALAALVVGGLVLFAALAALSGAMRIGEIRRFLRKDAP